MLNAATIMDVAGGNSHIRIPWENGSTEKLDDVRIAFAGAHAPANAL